MPQGKPLKTCFMARNNIIPIFVPHLGCPHNCVFCNQMRISGHEKAATKEDVYEATKGYKDCQVAFYGGSFTAIPKEQQIELLSAANGFDIRLSTRPDAIDEEILSCLKKYGVSTIELGAQSMDDEVLRLSGRGHMSKDVENASNMIKDAGFKLILQMMTGLPGDSEEKTINTARKIADLNPDGVRIYPTVIVRDTPLFVMWQKGLYREHTVEEAVEWCSKILPIFDEKNIPVIRLGLNPTDDLSGGDAVGGAYHPALGELVRSRIMRNDLENRLNEMILKEPDKRQFVIEVPANKLSQAIGQHRCNVEYLESKYSLQSLKIVMYNN